MPSWALAELASPLLGDGATIHEDHEHARNLSSPYSPTGLLSEDEAIWYAGMDVRCIVESAAPFRILEATPDWLRFTGFTTHEVRGRTLKVLQGVRTELLKPDLKVAPQAATPLFTPWTSS